MGKYERRTRPGWMLYHENLPMLEALPPEDVKALIVALMRYSVALANDEPPPDFSNVASPMGQAMCQAFSARIARDDRGYKETCARRSQRSTKDDLSQLKLTKADLRQVTKLNDKQAITQQKYNSTVTELSDNPAETSRVEAERNFCGGGFDLNHEAERRARSKHDNASELDIQRELRDLQRAEQLARTYGLPQTLAVYDSILEDVKRCDWEQVESAIKEASASNSRGCVSVNFYRTILKNRRIPLSHTKEL